MEGSEKNLPEAQEEENAEGKSGARWAAAKERRRQLVESEGLADALVQRKCVPLGMLKGVHSCNSVILNRHHSVEPKEREFDQKRLTEVALEGSSVTAHLAKGGRDAKIKLAAEVFKTVHPARAQERAKSKKGDAKHFLEGQL